jgi:hypothetical protein
MGSSRDGALNPGIVANRVSGLGAMDSLNAGHSLGRVKERAVGTEVRSGSESVNRWCTNAMLARSNARGRRHKFGGPRTDLMVAHGLAEAAKLALGRDLHATENV